MDRVNQKSYSASDERLLEGQIKESMSIAEKWPSDEISVSHLLPSLIGVFLGSADSLLLLVTQDAVATSLQSTASAPLLIVSYNLGFGIALPVYGNLCDFYGCRRFMLSAYGLFAIGSLVSGLATSVWLFVLGRFIAGIGGAGMTELVSVFVTDMFGARQIPTIRSYLLCAGTLGRVSGGPLGAVLTDIMNWRWSLICQVPIALLCLVVSMWQLPLTGSKPHKEGSKPPRARDLDFLGIACFAISMSFLTLLMNQEVLVFLNTRLILLTLLPPLVSFGVFFVLIERFWAKHPIMPPGLFCIPGVGTMFLTQVLYLASFYTINANIGPFFARLKGISNLQISLRLWPTYMGILVGAPIAGKIMNLTVRYKKLCVASLSLGAIAQLLIAAIWDSDGFLGPKILYILPWSVSAGLYFSAQFIALTACSPKERLGTIISIYHFSQQVGAIVGTSSSSALVRSLFSHILSMKLPQMEQRGDFINKIVDNVDFTATLPDGIQSIVKSSYVQACRSIPFSAFCWVLLAIPLMVFHRERKLA